MNDFESILALIGKNQELLERIGWFPGEVTSPTWWGGLESADEIVISALLVQQQTWKSVKRVLDRMKAQGHSSLASISNLSLSEVEELIRGSNFYKTKARRILGIARDLAKFGELDRMLRLENRDELLSIEGIGEETADALLLFAGNQRVLPVSTYVRRTLERVLGRKLSANELRSMRNDLLPRDLYSYKLFYAGLSTVGSVYCRKDEPDCKDCFLNVMCSFAKTSNNGPKPMLSPSSL